MKALPAVWLFFALSLASAAPPSITKVEPPDWPAGAQAITLRVLLTGSNLTGARVASPFPSDHLTITAPGTHLFVDLHLPAHPSPGAYSLRVDNGEGIAVARFAIVAPQSSAAVFKASRPMTSSIS